LLGGDAKAATPSKGGGGAGLQDPHRGRLGASEARKGENANILPKPKCGPESQATEMATWKLNIFVLRSQWHRRWIARETQGPPSVSALPLGKILRTKCICSAGGRHSYRLPRPKRIDIERRKLHSADSHAYAETSALHPKRAPRDAAHGAVVGDAGGAPTRAAGLPTDGKGTPPSRDRTWVRRRRGAAGGKGRGRGGERERRYNSSASLQACPRAGRRSALSVTGRSGVLIPRIAKRNSSASIPCNCKSKTAVSNEFR